MSDGGFGGASMSMSTASYVRGKPGLNLVVTYGFTSVVIENKGYYQRAQEAQASLGMAGKYYANSMKSGATVYNEGVPLVGEIGTLTKTAATSVGSKVFQGILKQKGLLRTVKDRRVYDLQLDWDKVEAEALRGGRSFNAELVARLE